jgi:hypothetical protein
MAIFEFIINSFTTITANGPVYAPLIGAGFAEVFVLIYDGLWSAKTVTITNGVYTLLTTVPLKQITYNL